MEGIRRLTWGRGDGRVCRGGRGDQDTDTARRSAGQQKQKTTQKHLGIASWGERLGCREPSLSAGDLRGVGKKEDEKTLFTGKSSSGKRGVGIRWEVGSERKGQRGLSKQGGGLIWKKPGGEREEREKPKKVCFVETGASGQEKSGQL